MSEEQALVVIGVVLDQSYVLVVQRRHAEGQLNWQFPGGAVEPGETETRAIEREVTEETGINCRAITKLGQREHPNTGRRIAYWQCEYIDGNARLTDPEDLKSVRWIERTKAEELFTTDIFPPVKVALSET